MVGAPGAPLLSVPQSPAQQWHLGLPDLRLERMEDTFLLCDGKTSNSIQGVFWRRLLLPEVKKKMTLPDSAGRLLGAIPKADGAS